MNDINICSENYLEVIYELSIKNPIVRSTDIATVLNVSKPSVNKAMGILQSAQMITKEPYGSISLTKKGLCKAKELSTRHDTVKNFFVDILKVDETVADNDACKIEHIISDETINKLKEFMKNNK